MSQTKGSGARHPARRLTPEQRRRVLEMRRRQRRRKRLMIAIPVAIALVAAAVGLRFALGGRGDAGGSESLTASAALSPDGAGVPAEAGGAETALDGELPAAEAGDPLDASGGEASADSAPNAQDSSQIAPSGGSFVFDEAYVSAVQGKETGPVFSANLSDVDPAKANRWPAAKNGYMPVLYHADNVEEKVIAITVDDCFQASNLRQIVQCALDNGGKLTIFPIGRNLEKQSIAEAVKWAWENGMEIENHTYSHEGTYHYDDSAMIDDVWRQSYLLNQALGVNYEQHFYRPKGGDERSDQRAHAYACQLGMRGIAMWTGSGSSHSVATVLRNMKPGGIYLYHTTDKDLKSLLEFIPEAVRQGYRLVTLNEMFGLPENRTSDLSTALQSPPALQPFRILPLEMERTCYMRAAAVIQERLIELGWMKGEATGVYGDSTRASMMLFQASSGLTVDGVGGQESQEKLFSDGAEAATLERVKEIGATLDSSAKKAILEMFK